LNGNSTVRVQVGRRGDQAVAHVRLHTLGAFADRLGLGDVLSARIRQRGAGPAARSGHGAGAGHADARRGGVACNDIEHLRVPARPVRDGASDSTLYGTFRQLNLDTLGGCRRRWVRWAGVWRRAGATPGTAPTILDIDASLHEIHSEHKEQAAANYKGS
jgi:hypothetical protein